jgi:hypothetical protein
LTTACVVAPFEVRTNLGNPWSGVKDSTLSPPRRDATNAVGKVFVFDPSAVCDVTECEAIRLIQVIQDIGEVGGSYVPLTATSIGYIDGPQRDSTRTTSGFLVDAAGYVPNTTVQGTDIPAFGERDPYMNGDDLGYDIPRSLRGTTLGFGALGLTNVSRAFDPPYSGDEVMQRLGVTARVKRYETCAFCSAGDQQGQYLGKVTWRWRRPLGGNAAIDSTTTSRLQPSSMFLDALQKWETVRGKPVPRVNIPIQGGSPCP